MKTSSRPFFRAVTALVFTVSMVSTPLLPTQAIVSSNLGPKIETTTSPAMLRIGQGETFSYSANATDADGIDRLEIYVNDARVKICTTSDCVFTATYWTNGLSTRDVRFSTTAYDKAGDMNRSNETVLTITDTQPISPTKPIIAHKTWVDSSTLLLNAGEKTTYHLEASSPTGLDHADIWMNGLIKAVCDLSGQTNCNQSIDSKDYPAGTEIFVNADIHDNAGTNVWTQGIRIQRPVPGQAVTPVPVTAKATLTVTPSKDIRRGVIVTAHTEAIHSTKGLARIDMYLNGNVARACSFGTATSLVSCDLSFDTTSYPEGSLLTFSSRGVDTDGNDVWSNEQTLVIGASATGGAVADQSGIYISGSADRTDAAIGETVNIVAMGWSPSGQVRITIFRNGERITDCPSDICRASIKVDTLPIVFTARLTDNVGREIWIEPQTVNAK